MRNLSAPSLTYSPVCFITTWLSMARPAASRGCGSSRRWLRTTFSCALAILSLCLVQSAMATGSPNLVLSQVYGGGGNTGAQYTNDFIEIFNRGTGAVSLSGKSLQYTSATGTGNFGVTGQITVLPNVTLNPGQYFLVQEAGGAVGSAL